MTRVALVTGAARGIGASTVRGLAAKGWAVVATDLCADDPALDYPLGTKQELQTVVADAGALAGDPDAVVARAVDARDLAALEETVEWTEHRFGGLDAAVAVAGVIAGGTPLWEMPLERQQAVLDTDLGAVLSLARATIPALLRRPLPRHGRFLAVASVAATRGLPLLAAYCAAKAGVTGLIRGLAAELGGTGVTANAVSPGSTDTVMLAESARLYGLPGSEPFAAQQPARRLLRPDEVAAALVWLASEESSALTGAVVPVDGGLAL